MGARVGVKVSWQPGAQLCGLFRHTSRTQGLGLATDTELHSCDRFAQPLCKTIKAVQFHQLISLSDHRLAQLTAEQKSMIGQNSLTIFFPPSHYPPILSIFLFSGSTSSL